IRGEAAPLEPVDLKIDAANALYDFKGFGGNYCFQIDTPHTLFTLQNLQPKVARVEMSLKEWEPENDNASAVATDLRRLEEHDQPDTKLHNELELASKLQAQGIPLVASVWELPRWLYVDGGEQRERHGPIFGKVDIRQLDELAESVGSYLYYARWKYAVEPEYFSFNEPDIGMRVEMTPREHRRALVAVAKELQRRKLKTKVLVGDVANMRDSLDYVRDVLENRTMRRHAGAIGIHSWLGATPETSREWRKMADKYDLPLLVTEMGFDPYAHEHKQWMMSFNYGMREARLQQQLLRDTQPQGSYYWQFTKDYSLLKEEEISTTQTQLVPTERYNFMGHLTMLTPGESAGLATESTDPEIVYISAFKGPRAAESQTLVIHILNTSGERTANLDGLGVAASKGRRFVSTRGNVPQVSEVAAPGGAKMELQLPARSLTTLVFPGVR
ncbi:MAG: glycosyl hydrolase, partial [Candidatus Sumerlaeota bacterium]